MVHMMQPQQSDLMQGFPDMEDLTSEQRAFLSRLLGGQQAGQGGEVSSFLDGGPAGDLFTGGPGYPAPELPELPDMPTTPTIPPTGEENWWEIDENNNDIPDAFENINQDPEIFTPSPTLPNVFQETPMELPPLEDHPEPRPDGDPEEDTLKYHPDGTGRDHLHPHTKPQNHTHFGLPNPEYPITGGDGEPGDYTIHEPVPHGGGPATATSTSTATATNLALNVAEGGAGGLGGTGQGGTGMAAGAFTFDPVFNIMTGGPVQQAVDQYSSAWDQYQQALMDKYYADTIYNLGMAALDGGGGGRDVVGPVGLFNRVTQGGGRYQQPEPFVKKKRKKYPNWPPDPKNPSPPHPPVPWPNGGQNPLGLTTMTADLGGTPAADVEPAVSDVVSGVEPGDFDAGQFVSDVQADAAGDVQADAAGDVQADVGFLPPIPKKKKKEWKKRDTKEFLEEIQGSGPVVHPGLQPRRLTLANPKALASLQQRPPDVMSGTPIPQMRHMGGPAFPTPQRPWPIGETPKAAAPLDSLMGDIMGGAGVPLGGQIAAQVEKTAAQRGQDYAQATYGLKGQERSLAQEQDRFRQQKVQDTLANLLSKRGRRGR